jgi:hypothetical protein
MEKRPTFGLPLLLDLWSRGFLLTAARGECAHSGELPVPMGLTVPTFNSFRLALSGAPLAADWVASPVRSEFPANSVGEGPVQQQLKRLREGTLGVAAPSGCRASKTSWFTNRNVARVDPSVMPAAPH